MATVTKFKVEDRFTSYEVDPKVFRYKLAVASGDANSGDDIEVFSIPPGYVLVAATLYVSGTLGALVTLKLRAGTADLTGATTAGGASTVVQNALDGPATSKRTVNLLVGGGNIGAAATVIVQGIIAPVREVDAPVQV